jgi:hypothetical protein
MTDKAILNRPILTLDGKNRQENDTSEDHTIPSNKAIIKDAASVGNGSLVAVQKASVNSKTEPAAEQKADYDFNAIYNELHAKFPKIINMKKPVLLAIAIRGEILKEVSAPNDVMYKWIAWYFRKSNYYAIHVVGAMRYNLDGTEAGIVTEKDQAKRDKQLGKNKNNNLKPEGSTQEKVISTT